MTATITPFADDLAAARAVRDARGPDEEAAAAGTPRAALVASQVDLIDLAQNGIPEREFVPGAAPWVLKAKRYLIVAGAGTGKSLLVLNLGVDIVKAGGSIVFLDVENGADEYARRLSDILASRDPDGSLTEACGQRLRYYAWPALKANWPADEWVAALGRVDVVVFDSSRLILSAAGLSEDDNDEYATFINGLVIPLARAGITTLVLDNTGHDAGHRARGASTKADLNEVVYLVKVGEPFDRNRRGRLRLIRERTRFADLPGELHVQLGGGTYGSPTAAEPGTDSTGFRPTALMEKASRAIEESPGLSRNDVLSLIGRRKEYAAMALSRLIAEHHVRVEHGSRGAHHHYCETPYREADDPLESTGSPLGPDQVPDPVGPLGPRVPLPEGGPGPGPKAQDPVTGSRDSEAG